MINESNLSFYFILVIIFIMLNFVVIFFRFMKTISVK